MPTIFVCGATGTQGGALVSNILKSPGLKAHAVARDPSSEASEALKARGVTIFKGDFNDEDSLRVAIQGCTGLFINLALDLTDLTQEVAQAKRLLSVGKKAGVEHVIYSSGISVDQLERHRHWDPSSLIARALLNKREIEHEVRTAGFKYYTIIRPGNFMTNVLTPLVNMQYPELVEKAEVTTPLAPDVLFPMVDTDDIGKFGVAAFQDPERFNAKEFEIASELMRLQDVMKAISKVTGRDVKINYMSQEEIDNQISTNPLLAGQLLFSDIVEFVDMDSVRAWGIPLGTFEDFLPRERERVAQTYFR
ncbi:NmrA/HSCARG family protein [Aspergillus lucknowensis]|uniref:NmrA-like domain-containing protein n=1 Tax=Aspergillus lucknowensis TaxID=176173 RepID=A0ABR4M1T9_9EURO